jgi:chemotaxis methyl-accepting protein methylase
LHISFADHLNLSARPVDFAPAAASEPAQDAATLQGEDREFRSWLLEHAGVDVSHYRPESLARRLPACLRTVRANSSAHARGILERNRNLIGSALGAVLIGVTSFFRDAQVFKDLDELVLAPLADRARIRVWSVGCSEGMELYSVMMLLAERRVLHRCQLLGTDCRLSATRAAADGTYPASVVRELPASLLERYFLRADDADAYMIHPFLRAQVEWRTADVLTTPEPGPWDLILCRNMAMYMRGQVMTRLWDILQQALRPGGHHVLGKAERPHTTVRLAQVAPCIYRRAKG